MAKSVKSIDLKSKVHPKERANIISLLTFFYTFSIFKKGFRKDLESSDLYDVLSNCKSKQLGEKMENAMAKLQKNSSIFRLLWKCFGKYYIIFGLVHLVMRTIFVLVMPEAIGKLIAYFAPNQTQITREEAFYYAAMVIGSNIIQFLYVHNYSMALTEFTIRIRTALCSLIFRKSLKLSEKDLVDISIGKIITLITKDLHALEMLVHFGNEIWISLIQTMIICYLIYLKIGVPAFVGVGFFFAILPLQILIGKLATSYRLKTCKKTDERLQLTQEVFSAIKIIKMYTWEPFFASKLNISRKKEVSALFKLFYLKIIIIVIGEVSAKVAFYLLIMSYIWMGNTITAENVYFVKACFGKLTHLLTLLLPLGICFGAEFYATIIRLRKLLATEELPDKRAASKTNTPKIILKDISMLQHKNISFEIEKGLHVIKGHMGAGKTTFIKTILQNSKILEGEIKTSGRISYASQDPWLFPSSIRDNILFGATFNADRYDKILEVCALKQDFASFENRDFTIIGDHGLNLSKGQQARINLARAIYRDADIYLLDDCLAALDGKVSDFIFERCIRQFLKDKLVIFATNNDEYISRGDNIITIESNYIKSEKNHQKSNEEFDTELEDYELKVKPDKSDEKPELNFVEDKKSGKVAFDVYRKYFKLGGGYIILSIIMLMFVAVQVAMSYSEKLVSNWVTLEQNISDLKVHNQSESQVFEELSQERNNLLILYTVVVLSFIILSLIRSLSFFAFTRKASIKLFKVMLHCIMGAKMNFFDTHFLGNVLNRFSKDLCNIDDNLPVIIQGCFDILFRVFGIIGLVAIVNPIFLIPAAIFFILIYVLRFIYIRTSRSLQRLEASTRGPLIGHLSASLEGLTTIKAFNCEDLIKSDFDRRLDLYTSANYSLQNSTRALGFVLDSMCSVFITLVIARFLLLPFDTTVGNVGLAITQAFHLTGVMQFGIQRWADFENNMTSVERVLEFTEIEQESKKPSDRLVKPWPDNGTITYDKVSLIYGLSKRSILKQISFDVPSRRKIGIVGRTGAGKSSIISTLFRLYDIEGKIEIDGVNTQNLSLTLLRSNISIIPQDPVIFTGTIRDNIDPLKQYSDEEIWRVVKLTQLHTAIKNLTDPIDDKANFSMGQRQLICLARALIRKNRIVVLDEATANLDSETDELMRSVIDEHFSTCTVLIIAHRLSSVLATDAVMFIDDGRVVEMDQPKKLLENKNSRFAKMVKQQ